MKNTVLSAILALSLASPVAHAAEKIRDYKAYGEVVSVDPLYSQITIEHGAIKGFSGSGSTAFYMKDPSMLKEVSKYDLVEFEFTDTKGDVRIDKISKTGVALPREEGVPFGQAVSDTFRGVGDVAKTVTSPIPPVSDAMGGAMNSAADATGEARIKDGEVKQKLATF